ncbi:phiSA1p31-related protein [Streptomyces sp. NPDC057245]|uniref:phiSA1p31-related protein n=1 Tax=Streptomyces sp. NPDC057245 TaxID=3346065 RepID=UPI00362E680C
MTDARTPDSAVATLTRAYELLEDEAATQHLGVLRQPLADLFAQHLSGDRHGPIPTAAPAEPDPTVDEALTRPGSGACYSCGDTGVRYEGVGADGHQWSTEQCCCQHEHCRCGACGGFPCEEVDAVVHLAAVLLREHGPHDAAHLAAVPSVEHAGQQYLLGYPYADRDGDQWEILEYSAHDGTPLVLLMPAGAGEPTALPEILEAHGPLRRIAHPGATAPTPDEALPYWGQKRWDGAVARCPGIRHLAPVGDDGLMNTHSISAGFTGRCPGSNQPPRTAAWPR